MKTCKGCDKLSFDIEFESDYKFVTYRCNLLNREIYRRIITTENNIDECPVDINCPKRD